MLRAQQIEFLQDGEYEYDGMNFYPMGSDEPWSFYLYAELEIIEKHGLLIARDGPSEELGSEGVPEYVIRLSTSSSAVSLSNGGAGHVRLAT